MFLSLIITLRDKKLNSRREGRRVCATAHPALKKKRKKSPPHDSSPTLFGGTLLAATDAERYMTGETACQSCSAPPVSV